MTITTIPALLGRFDKTKARKYRLILKDQGIEAAIQEMTAHNGQTQRFSLSVSAEDLSRAAQLIKDYEYEFALNREQKRKKAEKNAIILFLLFAISFVVYVVVTHH